MKSTLSYSIIALIFLFLSCGKDEMPDFTIVCSSEGCQTLALFEYYIEPSSSSLTIHYGNFTTKDADPTICYPDALDFFISEDNSNFEIVQRVAPEDGSIVIGNLKLGKEYYIKMTNVHCTLESVDSEILAATVGDLNPPTFRENEMPESRNEIRELRVSPNPNTFFYLTEQNNWHVTSFIEQSSGKNLSRNATDVDWNPVNESEVVYATTTAFLNTENQWVFRADELIIVDVFSENFQTLVSFANSVEYWVNDVAYALDSELVYFTVTQDDKVFNLWQVDVATNAVNTVTNFALDEFHIEGFAEDPLTPGNFYMIGKSNNETNNIHYFDASTASLTSVLATPNNTSILSVDPSGKYLIYDSTKSGQNELYSYDLSSLTEKQITASTDYSFEERRHINWTSDNEFIIPVMHDSEQKFGVFNIGE